MSSAIDFASAFATLRYRFSNKESGPEHAVASVSFASYHLDSPYLYRVFDLSSNLSQALKILLDFFGVWLCHDGELEMEGCREL